MTQEEFYLMIDSTLGFILENLEKIYLVSNAFLILFCGCMIYHLFWGSKR